MHCLFILTNVSLMRKLVMMEKKAQMLKMTEEDEEDGEDNKAETDEEGE